MVLFLISIPVGGLGVVNLHRMYKMYSKNDNYRREIGNDKSIVYSSHYTLLPFLSCTGTCTYLHSKLISALVISCTYKTTLTCFLNW